MAGAFILGATVLALWQPPCALHARQTLKIVPSQSGCFTPASPRSLASGVSSAAATAKLPRCRQPLAKLFEPTPLVKGEEYEGLISKITDYGFFVRIGHEQHIGLVHIRTLSRERVERAEIMDWIEREVGPVGSKVVVEVLGLEFKGQKRTSLRLKDVLSRQYMEDLVVSHRTLRASDASMLACMCTLVAATTGAHSRAYSLSALSSSAVCSWSAACTGR